MESVQPNTRRPATPDYTIPDDFRVADLLDREAWELGGPEEKRPDVGHDSETERGPNGVNGPDGERGPGGVEEEAPLEARVLFRFPASLRVDRQGRGELVEERDDGAAVREFRVRQPGPFVRWLLTFRGEARILSPPELRASMEEMARTVAALYGDGVEEVP